MTNPAEQFNKDILRALDIAAEYRALGVELVGSAGDGKEWVSCWAYGRPHGDSPSAEVNVKTGRYKDFGGDGVNMSFWDFAASTGLFADWRTARDHFAAKAGVETPKKKKTKRPDKDLNWLPWNEVLVGLWCLRKPPITPESIRENGGRLARYLDRFSVIALPVYPDGRLGEPCGYVLWNLTGGELPCFHGKNEPITWEKMKTTYGSEKGWIGEWGLRRITTAKRTWKVEGPGDMLAAWSSMSPEQRETDVVVTNSGGCGEHPSAQALKMFAGKPCGVVHDCDVPGQEGANGSIERNRPGWAGAIARETECRNVVLPYPVAEKHGKDLRDFLNDGRSYSDLVRLFDQAANVSATPITSHEGPDDPHRLARCYLQTEGTRDGILTTRFWRGEWWKWRDGSYMAMPSDELAANLVAFTKEEFDRINLLEQSTADGEAPFARKVSRQLIGDIAQALRGMCVLEGKDDPFWICEEEPWPKAEVFAAANALVHVPTLADNDSLEEPSIPATPEFFTLNAGGWEFTQSAPMPTNWYKFLGDVWENDQQSIDLLQEWFGYILLPDLRHDKMLMLVGPPRSGKGTICTVLTNLIGERSVVNPTLKDLCDVFAPHSFVGRTLAIVADARLDGRNDTQQLIETILNITGRDPREIRRKHADSLRDVKLHTRMMICSNELPDLKDASGALAGRALILSMRKSNLGKENKNLLNELMPELPGIFLWAVQGYLRLSQQLAFTEPESMRDIQDEYHRLTSPLKAFIDDRCIVGLREVSPCNTIYSAWKSWCEEQGLKAGKVNGFGKKLRAAVPMLDRFRPGTGSDRDWWYSGVSLRAEQDANNAIT